MGRFDYTPSRIARMKEAEVRKLYSEYRKIANKRAQRMRNAGYTSYEAAKANFAKTKDLSADEVRAAFAEVNKYLRDVRTKIKPLKAYEKETLEQLHEHGYDFVNAANLKEFGDFMEWSRARSGANDRVFKSDRAADIFGQAQKQKISTENLKKNFDAYAQSYERSGTLSMQRRKNNVDSDSMWNRFSHTPASRRKR